jgi:hypothetical protein
MKKYPLKTRQLVTSFLTQTDASLVCHDRAASIECRLSHQLFVLAQTPAQNTADLNFVGADIESC